MNIKGILFDFDGTLANTIPLCIRAYQHVFEQYTGRTCTASEVMSHFGTTEAGIFQRTIPDRWQDAFQSYLEIYKKLHTECPAPFDGIEHILRKLDERGIALAVVTGKGEECALFSLEYLGLARYFDIVEVGDTKAIIKAAAMRKILDAWRMEPRCAAYVGDAASDMEEAAAAGVLPLGACWSETATIHHLTTIQPFATFNSVADFDVWLDQHIANGA
ncbi:MAG TPA: HAD hydrolase-like protein [Ktedonobacteraceae bacterium]|jgi:phosphoglycolate phosphatase-like HAD superfamily hydrolase|nr:HAD hydrolase-like protein [Ktedonobacteraceae bacterium]